MIPHHVSVKWSWMVIRDSISLRVSRCRFYSPSRSARMKNKRNCTISICCFQKVKVGSDCLYVMYSFMSIKNHQHLLWVSGIVWPLLLVFSVSSRNAAVTLVVNYMCQRLIAAYSTCALPPSMMHLSIFYYSILTINITLNEGIRQTRLFHVSSYCARKFFVAWNQPNLSTTPYNCSSPEKFNISRKITLRFIIAIICQR